MGGDGIVSVAKIISDAALNMGMNLKQSEIHGMSQRGGSVFSHLRISDNEIFADVIPEGNADIIPLPKNHEENVKIIEEEVNYNGVSVIIPHRTCIVELKKHMKK